MAVPIVVRAAGRRLVCAGFLSLLGLAVVAGTPVSAAVAGDASTQLRGVNTFVGNEAGSMTVTLPRTASVDASDGVRVEGVGRFAGLVLVRDQPGRDKVTLLAGTARMCSGAACQGEPLPRIFNASGVPHKSEARLPAGTYRVILIADSTPVKVVLSLDGLTGSRVLRPQTRASVNIIDAADALPAEGPGVATASTTRDVRENGLLVAVDWWETDHSLATLRGYCLYEGPPSPTWSFSPACSRTGASEAGTSQRLQLPPGGPGYASGTHVRTLPSGSWTFGSYVYSPEVPTGHGATHVWVDY